MSLTAFAALTASLATSATANIQPPGSEEWALTTVGAAEASLEGYDGSANFAVISTHKLDTSAAYSMTHLPVFYPGLLFNNTYYLRIKNLHATTSRLLYSGIKATGLGATGKFVAVDVATTAEHDIRPPVGKVWLVHNVRLGTAGNMRLRVRQHTVGTVNASNAYAFSKAIVSRDDYITVYNGEVGTARISYAVTEIDATTLAVEGGLQTIAAAGTYDLRPGAGAVWMVVAASHSGADVDVTYAAYDGVNATADTKRLTFNSQALSGPRWLVTNDCWLRFTNAAGSDRKVGFIYIVLPGVTA